MKKAVTILCSIMAMVLMGGCGSVMPDLTQEETEIISEYAAGVLLKYDRVSNSRLMSQSELEAAEMKKLEKETQAMEEPEQEEENSEAASTDDTEVVDVSQDGEAAAVPSTIEEHFGIQNISFEYTGYELAQSYPSGGEDGSLFFAMDATEGMQLLVLKFTAANTGSADQTLNMMDYGARFRISVNGEAGKSALSTMLLNDLQSYNDVIPAGSSVELVSIVEVPQSIAVESVDFTLRGDAGSTVIKLQ